MADNGACAICAMVRHEPTGGWAYQDDSFVAGILPGLEIPGWLVLALRRHDVAAAPLSAQEAMDLGVAIGRLTTALVATTDAERVYLQAYGEREQHWHLLLCARGADVPAEHRHINFFAHRARYFDVEEAESVEALIRARISGPEPERLSETPGR